MYTVEQQSLIISLLCNIAEQSKHRDRLLTCGKIIYSPRETILIKKNLKYAHVTHIFISYTHIRLLWQLSSHHTVQQVGSMYRNSPHMLNSHVFSRLSLFVCIQVCLSRAVSADIKKRFNLKPHSVWMKIQSLLSLQLAYTFSRRQFSALCVNQFHNNYKIFDQFRDALSTLI